MKSVLVAIPMYNSSCMAGTCISLVSLATEAAKINDIKFDYLYALNESLIPKTRSMIVHAFLRSPHTHLLFIDSDITFDAKQIIQMVRADEDFTVGIYPKKSIKWERVAEAARQGCPPQQLQIMGSEYLFHANKENGMKANAKGLIEVDKAATGCMLLSREVFEKLKPSTNTFKLEDAQENVSDRGDNLYEFFKTSIDPETGVFLHEDFTFCKMWKDIGGKIYADPRVQLQHTGPHVFG